jgi:hypothetical protein
MATEIWTELDPNLDLPPDLKNIKFISNPDNNIEMGDATADIDIQSETLDDDDSLTDDEAMVDVLEPPGSFQIISQTIRTGLDGSQVVDVVVEVEDVPGAVSYNVRVSK